MEYIQKNAELAVRDMLKGIGHTNLLACGLKTLESIDYLDDGSIIKLSVQINIENGEAIFDFRWISNLNIGLMHCNVSVLIFYFPVEPAMKFGEIVMLPKLLHCQR